MAAAIDERFRAFVLLATYGGLRFGELAGLRRKSLDTLRAHVSVTETLVEVDGELILGPPKTKRSIRTVAIPRRTNAELVRHLERCVADDPEAFVFLGPKGARPRRAGFRRSWWLPALSKAGLDGLRVHDLRHTFVALWIDAGRRPDEVSAAAGHSSVQFTLDRYGHRYEKSLPDIQDALDELLTAQSASETRATQELAQIIPLFRTRN